MPADTQYNYSWSISKSKPFTILPGLHFVLALFSKRFLKMSLSLISCVTVSNGSDFPHLPSPKKVFRLVKCSISASSLQSSQHSKGHSALSYSKVPSEIGWNTWGKNMNLFSLRWVWFSKELLALLFLWKASGKWSNWIQTSSWPEIQFAHLIDICPPLRFSISLLRSQVVWPNFKYSFVGAWLKAPLYPFLLGW